MPITQADFITQTQAYLWRPGDTELANELPTLITFAESRIRRDLHLQASETTLNTTIDSDPWPLPADCQLIRTLSWEDRGPGIYTTPYDFQRTTIKPLVPGAIRPSYRSANLLEYTVKGQNLHHRMTVSAENPLNATLVYQPIEGDLATDDSTLYDAYPDLYQYAVNCEALKWLLEDQRAMTMNADYDRALDRVLADQSYQKYGQGPLKMSMPRRDVS